jgi:hypothetical protein
MWQAPPLDFTFRVSSARRDLREFAVRQRRVDARQILHHDPPGA